MLPDRAVSTFMHLSGALEAAGLDLTAAPDVVVVAYQGDYWVCTREELARILDLSGRQGPLGNILAAACAPALVREVDRLDPEPSPFAWRIAVTDRGEVIGAIIDGPLAWLDESLRDDIATAAPEVEPGEDLGPSRGPGEPESPDAGETGPPKEPWNLETRFPRQVAAGSVTSLVVEVTRQASTDPEASVLPFRAQRGTRVGVVVQPQQGFEVVGAAEGTLEASDDSLPLRFQLRATGAAGPGRLRVLFFIEATAVGAITLEPVITEPESSPDAEAVASSEVISTMSVGRGRPDLELLVLEEDAGNSYSIRVTAADESLGIHLREFGPIRLRSDPRQFFAELFADIEALDLQSSNARATAQKLLETKGNHLFTTLIPEALRTVLWEISDRITRIRVDSEEPHIPWELIRLSGPTADGTIKEGKFLCEYEFTRWIPGNGLHSDLTLKDFGVVIPPDSGLASAEEERQFIAGLGSADRQVSEVPSTIVDVLSALATGRHDVWHFSGHGSVKDDQDPNRAAIQLAEGQRLTPEQISGTQANLGRADPLVFFNACQIGRAALSLTGLGGWAQQFLSAGASAFVGPMWNVHDNPARDFAKTFYTRLLAGDSIGAATLAARTEIKRYQDATWLAYTVYGHPSAALSMGKG